MLEPPTPARARGASGRTRSGRIWVSEWNAGQVGHVRSGRRDAGASGSCPGEQPQAYAVYVDERDNVWLSDFGANALVRFDPAHRAFDELPAAQPPANVRQLLGRPGEVWGAESGRGQARRRPDRVGRLALAPGRHPDHRPPR